MGWRGPRLEQGHRRPGPRPPLAGLPPSMMQVDLGREAQEALAAMHVGGTLLFPFSFPRDRFGEQVGLRPPPNVGPMGAGKAGGCCYFSHLQLTGDTPLDNAGTKTCRHRDPVCGGRGPSFSFEPIRHPRRQLGTRLGDQWALARRGFRRGRKTSGNKAGSRRDHWVWVTAIAPRRCGSGRLE